MSTPETAAQTEREHPMASPSTYALSQMTGAKPDKLPQPTAPMAEEPRKTTTIQRVGWAIAALSVGVGIYMFFIA